MKTCLAMYVGTSLVALGLLGIATPSAPPVARTFVSTAGSDANLASNCGPTTPCRTFGVALSDTSAGGEIVVLTSGGYGPAPITITQSVSISAEGVHAAVSVASGDGITINAPGATVELRGLTLVGVGGTNGVHVVNAASVVLSGLTISGFQYGIDAAVPSSSATGPFPTIYVRGSRIQGNSVAGIAVGATTGSVGLVSAVIASSQLLNNSTGV